MQVIVFNAADTRLFVRDDAETAEWSVDQLSFTASFPYQQGKELQRGMRIGFTDADGVFQPFEIRKAKLYEPDHYQEITAEHIAVAELTDEFYQGEDVTDETPAQVLASLLTGTLWSVGNCTATNTSSLNIDKGSVWQNLRAMEKNWNVIIKPRVTFSATGITGRYIDVTPNTGTWRGVVLSVDSTMDEVGVVWDDSDLLTAVYGLGGNVENQSGGSEALTFADVVWTATTSHPAKPSGQTYIEDPTAKSLYGRNGRNRFGYYQNSNIKDADILLEKTWEYLQTVNAPTVTIDCLVRDLKRMGYAGQDIRLHDKVQVQIRPANKVLVLDVTKLDVDLLDPTATRPVIGKYIPNIVYINRETAQQAGVGYRVGGQSNKEDELQEFYTLSHRNEYNIKLEAIQRAYEDGQLSTSIGNNAVAIQLDATRINSVVAGSGVQLNSDGSLVVDSEGHPVFVDQNGNMFSQISQTKTSITQIVSAVGSNGQVTAASIALAINDNGSNANINADHVVLSSSQGTTVYLNDKVSVLGMMTISNGQLEVDGPIGTQNNLYCDDLITSGGINVAEGEAIITDSGAASFASVTVDQETLNVADVSVNGNTMTITYVDGTTANFSKATALSGAWSGSTYKVTASPQSEEWSINFNPNASSDATWTTETGAVSINSNNRAWIDVPFYIGSYPGQGQSFSASVTRNHSLNLSSLFDPDCDFQLDPGDSVDYTYSSGSYIGARHITITVSSGGGSTAHSNCADSLTQINAVSNQQATQMYAYVNGNLTNMGTGFWYLRSSYMAPITMYTT